MPDPGLALAVFSLVTVILVVLFWPNWGLASRLLRLVPATERVRIEDSLKHVFNAEYQGTSCTIESLAGVLEIPRSEAVKLVARLDSSRLVELSSRRGTPTLALTAAGREYALRILRTHRLWEQYLAERTGVNPSDWHDQAEVREHTLSAEDADLLAAGMGHPPYDPHGDPIPTAAGQLPPKLGVALTSYTAGRAARIVHLEDEPAEVYQQLVHAGLSPNMHIQLLESSDDKVRFSADGREHQFDPVVAASITIVPTRVDDVTEGVSRKLSDLRVGETGRVLGIVASCRGVQRRRLLDLGAVPGTLIKAKLKSPLGEPVAYDIRGAMVALRHEQADSIQISSAEESAVKVS